jgi:mannose-6-phosphate isomerase-like protein (cupin superfamily)
MGVSCLKRSRRSAWPRSTTWLRETGSATIGKRGSRAKPWPLSAPASRSFVCTRAKRSPFTHRHTEAEEIYVVLSGSGRVKLDDEIFDVTPLDSIRVAPATARAFEAGQDGLEFLAFGPHHSGDGEPVEDPWTEG